MNTAFLPRSTRAAEGLPRRRFTVAEVEAMVAAGIMDPDERVELIGGELVPMAAKGRRHERVSGALLDFWIRARTDDCRVSGEITLRLSQDTFLEPDLVIFPRAPGPGGISASHVLLVVEVAVASKRNDRGRKAKLYANFGVRELWVIDAVALTTRVFLSPAANGYRNVFDVPAPQVLVPQFAPSDFALALQQLELEAF